LALSTPTFACVVIDDHPALVEAVIAVLVEHDIEPAGSAADGEAGLQLIRDLRPRVAIADVRMPGMSGIELAREVVRTVPETQVALYTGYGDRALLVEALDAGARGFILKEAPLDDLVRAVHAIARGETYVDPVLAGVLAGVTATEKLPQLTQREARRLAPPGRGVEQRRGRQAPVHLRRDRAHAPAGRDDQARGRHAYAGRCDGDPAVADPLTTTRPLGSFPQPIPGSGCSRFPVRAIDRTGDPHDGLNVRCLIADDHPGVLAALVEVLCEAGFEIAGVAADCVEAVELAAGALPDCAIVDYHMPAMEGPELLARLRAASPETAVVVYTGEVSARQVATALRQGAAGVVLKEAPLEDLLRAVWAVVDGRTYVGPAFFRVAEASEASPLTSREIEVLQLIAEGLSYEDIGGRLGIGSETARTHLKKASSRLGALTRTQAVATALRLGWIC
jgi:DNA-binding NarL/FixJ family response regulator